MTLFAVFTGTFNWLMNTLFGTVRPFLNPFIGERPLLATGSSPSSSTVDSSSTFMEPVARMLPRRPIRTGIFRSLDPSIESETTHKPPKSETWQPAIVDVLRTRRILIKASKNQLPLELINTILDYSEYWPHVSASKEKPIVARGNTAHQDVLVVRTPPICALATAGCEDESLGLPEPKLSHPARKVVFRIRSHDQGYSSEAPETRGTYQASYTWFDSEIDKEFGPMDDEEPLSRIPWELSSTRFLDVWPRHSHSIEDDVEERARIGCKWGEPYRPEQSQETGGNESIDPNHVLSEDEVPESSNNPEHPERPKARLFSHLYLQNHKYEVQYNVQSIPTMTEHTIVWRYTDDIGIDSPEADELVRNGRGRATGDGTFVRCLKLGDCVSLWAKARHPLWANHVETATVEVYFAI